MARNPLRRAHAVPVFTDAFLATAQELKAGVLRTRNVHHSGTKGAMREDSLATFLKAQLPKIYGVVSGETVDLDNRAGPQLDVLIYDQSRNFPFISNASVVLPAEALLASIEVKSKLNSAGIASSIEAVRRLRSLRPFKKELAGRNVGNAASSEPRARYFHSIFAYETDLSHENWAKKEYLRFIRGQLAQEHTIDVVYVLGRGVINLSERKFVLEDESTAHALCIFYFGILNFLDREGRRRGATPYASYATKMGGTWETIATE